MSNNRREEEVAYGLLTGLQTRQRLLDSWRLSEDDMRMLQRWASGDDARSVAEKFGVDVQKFEEVKSHLWETLDSVLEDMPGLTDKDTARHFLLQLLSVCASCGKPSDCTCKFCNFCGAPNELFDESAFFQSMGETIEEAVRSECDQGHPVALECAELWDEDSPYCPDCGKRPLFD
jgi:hypothetical protein